MAGDPKDPHGRGRPSQGGEGQDDAARPFGLRRPPVALNRRTDAVDPPSVAPAAAPPPRIQLGGGSRADVPIAGAGGVRAAPPPPGGVRRHTPTPADPGTNPEPAQVDSRTSGNRPIIDVNRARVELPARPSRFQPKEPRTWEELGIDELIAEQIVLRYLLGAGAESGRTLSTELALAAPLTKDLLEGMRQRKLVQHRTSTAMGDFVYELTEAGRDRGLDYRRQCTYVGPVPVPLEQYLQSVEAQTLRHTHPTPEDLERAFADLVMSDGTLSRLGPAISSCRALFLHGEPGNGKTSIAERVMRCFSDYLWIPQTLFIDGHLVKLYDPGTHEMVDPGYRPLTSAERLDRRWLRIRRPTVIAGGELTLEMLEIQESPHTHICEAPLQLKANGGVLVIDDFGRQRMPPQVLLNRWIFPLERRLDFLRLPDGRKITSPFDPLLVFSTNLEPRDLMDEAFLRRIPYKINVADPTEDEFVALIEALAPTMDIALAPGAAQYLVDRHYKRMKRPLRYCHPRDLLQQIQNQARFERRPALADKAAWDSAVSGYFGVM